MRSALRARVALCDCPDRHWAVTCPACPGDTFHCARLDDAVHLGSVHITRQHMWVANR